MNAMTEMVAPAALEPGTIRVNAGALRRAVTQVAVVVNRRNTIPVLGCLLIQPRREKLAISGTDLDTLMTMECPAECGKGAPSFVIPADLLKKLLAGAEAGETVEITKGPASDVLTLKIGPAVAQFRQMHPVEDFPLMAEVTATETTLQVRAAALAKVLVHCAPCISTEETRYYLNGIYLHARDGALAGVATDGHRMSLYQTETAWPLAGLIMPHPVVGMLAQLLGKAGESEVTVTGWETATRLRIAGPGWTMTLKTIDGTFPDYKRVIPKRIPDAGYAVLSPATLRRVPQVAKGTAAELDLATATLTVRDVCEGLNFTLPIEAKGSFTVGYNASYLRAFTHAFGTVRIEATSSGDAATILSEEPNWFGVLMPMRL